MSERQIGIVMHGVTGRMGTNQHLVRSILAIREQGGVALADGTRVVPEPIRISIHCPIDRNSTASILPIERNE